MRRRSQQGFTLVEILIGIAIFSVVSASVYFNFHMGVLLYSRTSQDLDRLTDLRLALNRMEKDLKNAILFEEVPFEGGKKRIRFPAIVEVYNKDEEKRTPLEIEYFLRGKALHRKINSLQDDFFQAGKEKDQVFLEGIKNLSFSFIYTSPDQELLWQNTWGDETLEDESLRSQKLPRAVRLNFELIPKNEEDPFHSIQKTIYLPQGHWEELKVG